MPLGSVAKLKDRVRILQESLYRIRGIARVTGRWMDNFGNAVDSEGNDGHDQSRKPDISHLESDPEMILYWEECNLDEQNAALEEIAGIADSALNPPKVED